MSVPKVNYAPFNPGILSFPADGILTPESGEGRDPGLQDQQHVSSTSVSPRDISSDGTSGSTSHLKPGYKSFNLALLCGYEQPTASSPNPASTRCTTPGPESETTLSEQVPTPQSPGSLAASDDGPDGNLPDVRPHVDNEQDCPATSECPSPMPPHSTEAHSTDQRDMNPFRTARLSLSTDLSASGTTDDVACGLPNEVGCLPATRGERFAAALAMRDAAAATDPPIRGNIPNPCAEVDPGDYG